ncbi:MAG: hypothetical protein PHR13_12700 [Dysgonamonadaceae bacterium]|nr:hypothetical protein [Dysgonamonadaceae bacterium]
MKGFNTEQELVNLFKTAYSRKFDAENTRVLEEVGVGFGIADLVITELKDSLYFEAREKLNSVDISVYQTVKNKKEISLEDIRGITGIGKSELKKSLTKLIEYSYLKEIDSLFLLDKKYELPFKKSIAFEAKLSNWKRAFMQAYRYKWFANYSYVLLDETRARPAIKRVSHFENHNVGLLTLSIDGEIKIYHRPKRQAPMNPSMQMMLSENLLYQ